MKTPGILDSSEATRSPDAPTALASATTNTTASAAQQRMPLSNTAQPDDDASTDALARKRKEDERIRLAAKGKSPDDDSTTAEALLALLENSPKGDDSMSDDNRTSGKPRALSDHFRGGNSKKKPKPEEETTVAEGSEEHPASEHAPEEEGGLTRHGRHLGKAAKYVGIGIASAAAGELAIDGGLAYAKGRLFDHETRGQALLSAGKSMLGNAGTVAKNVGWSLVPFYTSYEACKAGNYGQAIMWGVVDTAGLVAVCIPVVGEMAESGIVSAKVAKVAAVVGEAGEATSGVNDATRTVATAAGATDAVAVASTGERVMAIADKTATVVNRASTVYTRVQLARTAEDFREFAFSPKGKVLGEIFYEEALKGGVKPKDLAAFIKTQLPPTMPPAFADAMASQININNGTSLAGGSGKPNYRSATGMTPAAGTGGAGGALAAALIGSRPGGGNTPV